MINELLKC